MSIIRLLSQDFRLKSYTLSDSTIFARAFLKQCYVDETVSITMYKCSSWETQRLELPVHTAESRWLRRRALPFRTVLLAKHSSPPK